MLKIENIEVTGWEACAKFAVHNMEAKPKNLLEVFIMTIENFVSEKTFETGDRIFSGKMVKYLLTRGLIWSAYDDQEMKKNWLRSLRDDRYYLVSKRANYDDETDYWFQITRIYRQQYPEERAELKTLYERLRREREYHRNPRPCRIKG